MGVRLLRLVTLLCAALVTGLAFAHAMELPQKMAYDAELYRQVQASMYKYFAVVGGPLEVVSILLAAVLCWALRGRGAVFGWTVAGTVLLAAGLGEWAAVVQSANVELDGWRAGAIPAAWEATREQWEYGHVGHLVVYGLGFVALLWSTLIDRNPDRVP